MDVGWDTTLATGGDALVVAALLLATLLVARSLLGTALATLARLPGALGRTAAAAADVLRPGLARRLVATLLGLGTPLLTVATTAPPAVAAAVPAVASAVPAPRPAPTAASARGLPAPAQRAAQVVVVVRSGDTLWDIARGHLPASATATDVARAWPRWYAANRAAIGPDPALLRPGTRLRSPDRRPAGTPASSHDRSPGTRTDTGAVARSLDPDRR